MPSASLDALVIKLLETTQANTDKLNFRQIKNLVCQLPAAAAEVRGIQANNERNAPCTCGLDLEVVRLQKSLQVYIDEEPNTKKGNTRKTLGMENQHLTKLVTDQKKEMNGYLATIRRQGDEIERLRQNLKAAQDAHAWSEKLRMAASARVETVARAVGREASIGEHTESVSALGELAFSGPLGERGRHGELIS